MIGFVDETLCSTARERKDRGRNEHRHELAVDAAPTGWLGHRGSISRERCLGCSATNFSAPLGAHRSDVLAQCTDRHGEAALADHVVEPGREQLGIALECLVDEGPVRIDEPGSQLRWWMRRREAEHAPHLVLAKTSSQLTFASTTESTS